MFEKIVLRRSEAGPAISAGELAEALLYYSNVHLVLDYSSLNALIDQLGMPILLAVLNRKGVTAVYCEDSLGTHNKTQHGLSVHSFIAYQFAGSKESGKITSQRQLINFLLQRKGYKKSQCKRLSERFIRLIPSCSLGSDYFIKGGIMKAVSDDFLDDSYFNEAVRIAIMSCGVKNIPADFIFKPERSDEGFIINTNLDFDNLNAARRSVGLDGDWSKGNILQSIASSKEDLILASHYGSEFYTSDLSSSIIRLKYGYLLRKMALDKESIKSFEEIILENAPSIRSVINSRQKTFVDFLKLLDKADRFRDWASDVNPDSNLVREYFEELKSEGWLSSIPSKAIRYVTITALSAFNPISGAAASFADLFLLDKLTLGWKPSHFVEKRLKPFLGRES